MRITPAQKQFFKIQIKKIIKSAQIFLFGSRVNDQQKGGDIDILVIAERKLTYNEKELLRINFIKSFGDQKVDIVSFAEKEKSAFKNYVLSKAVLL